MITYKVLMHGELVQIGYDILGTVMDQSSDLEGPDNGIQVRIPNYLFQIVF